MVKGATGLPLGSHVQAIADAPTNVADLKLPLYLLAVRTASVAF